MKDSNVAWVDSLFPYNPEGFALDIFKKRYTLHDQEAWAEACERVGSHIASAESGDDFVKYRKAFSGLLKSNLFMPGGRIWYGSGRPKGQLLNCISGDTLVHTDKGLIKAKDLENQEVRVLSQDGVYRNSKWYCYGEQSLFKITLSNGDELFATAEHEWVVTKPKGGTEKVKTLELANRNIPMQGISSFNYNENEFKEGVRHGLTFGDGALYMGGKYSALRQFGDSREIVPRFFDKYSTGQYKDDLQGYYQVNRLPAYYKQLPASNATASYIRGFLAGLIGADGCTDTRGHVMLHHHNLERLIEIRKLASLVGLPTSSIAMTREFNPWTGERAPIFKLTFVKQFIDHKMLIKETHRVKFDSSSNRGKLFTVKVINVYETNRVENVYCCVEPITHTMVVGPGYLTGQCFVIPTDDSREGWGKSTSDMIVICGTGGGLGMNGSPIRPRNSDIHGTGGKATGAVSLFQIINAAGDVMKAGGGRRVALMQCLNLNHGDIQEFLDVKLDLNQLNNANISVVFNDNPEVFFEKVKKDEELELQFRGKVVGKVNAKAIWTKILTNALKNGEPGLLNGYLANKMSNVWYMYPLISTNPCGEIWLPAYGCCDLGALVLPKFLTTIERNKTDVNWELLKSTIALSVRFLDNVLTVNNYPLPEIKETCNNERRVGLGVMGLSTMLLTLGLKYNSPEALEFVNKLMNFIKNSAYEASIDLAKEKGSFPKFDAELFLKSGFVKTLKPSLRELIRVNGIRNCALLTLAPTGTTSIVCDVDSGIEPSFGPAWERRYRDGDLLATEVVVHPLFKQMYTEGKDVSHFQSVYNLKMRDHFEMQRICQKHIDNAVSKTINVPPGTSMEELSDLYMEFFPELKGVTVYPEGSRENQPITPLSIEQAVAHLNSTAQGAMSADNCKNGVCDVPWNT